MKANMTNEKKAREICCTQGCRRFDYCIETYGHPCDTYTNCVQIAEWKDEQFKESVNKAMKYLETNLQLTEAESTHIRKLFNF